MLIFRFKTNWKGTIWHMQKEWRGQIKRADQSDWVAAWQKHWRSHTKAEKASFANNGTSANPYPYIFCVTLLLVVKGTQHIIAIEYCVACPIFTCKPAPQHAFLNERSDFLGPASRENVTQDKPSHTKLATIQSTSLALHTAWHTLSSERPSKYDI